VLWCKTIDSRRQWPGRDSRAAVHPNPVRPHLFGLCSLRCLCLGACLLAVPTTALRALVSQSSSLTSCCLLYSSAPPTHRIPRTARHHHNHQYLISSTPEQQHPPPHTHTITPRIRQAGDRATYPKPSAIPPPPAACGPRRRTIDGTQLAFRLTLLPSPTVAHNTLLSTIYLTFCHRVGEPAIA
jgi:hypothetical protein